MRDYDVEIPGEAVTLQGSLRVPEPVAGVVVLPTEVAAAGTARGTFVADVLYRARLGTLLLDLLTPDEEAVRANVFDIELLAGRLTAATVWLSSRYETAA